MASPLQQLVDSLSKRLLMPVVIDDPRGQQQVYNTQFGSTDASRESRILTRTGNPEVAAYFQSFRTPWPETPITIPARPDLGVQSRVYMPIRHEEELLGHLWVFDSGTAVSESDFELIHSTAESAALVLNREQLLHDLERSRERELVRDLLSDDEGLRATAAEDLVALEFFPSRSPVQAVLVQPSRDADTTGVDSLRRAIALAMDEVRGSLTPGYVLNLIRNNHGLMLVSPLDPALRREGVGEVASALRDGLEQNLGRDKGGLVLAAISEEHPELRHAVRAYGQTQHAIRVASVAPSFGPITHWSRLGIYRMLSRFPIEELTSEALHPAVIELASRDDGHVILETIETYLDAASDAQAAAAALFIHRATLYYRLRRFTELTGTSLSSGEERLAVHLSLKLGRLTGLLDASSQTAAASNRIDTPPSQG